MGLHHWCRRVYQPLLNIKMFAGIISFPSCFLHNSQFLFFNCPEYIIYGDYYLLYILGGIYCICIYSGQPGLYRLHFMSSPLCPESSLDVQISTANEV